MPLVARRLTARVAAGRDVGAYLSPSVFLIRTDPTTIDPWFLAGFTSNDEVRREFSVVVTARPVGGEPTASTESSEVRWVAPGDVAGYTMGRAMRKRVDDYLRGAVPHID